MSNLRAAGAAHHAMRHPTCVKCGGIDSGARLAIDANAGILEEIVKH